MFIDLIHNEICCVNELLCSGMLSLTQKLSLGQSRITGKRITINGQFFYAALCDCVQAECLTPVNELSFHSFNAQLSPERCWRGPRSQERETERHREPESQRETERQREPERERERERQTDRGTETDRQTETETSHSHRQTNRRTDISSITELREVNISPCLQIQYPHTQTTDC